MRKSPAFLVASFLLAAPLLADTFTVNSTVSANDGCDESPDPQVCDTGSCASPSGLCSIHAAIRSANDEPGADEIGFSVPAITFTADLPAILDPVTIGPASPPRVDLNGNGSNSGLVLDEMAAGSVIRNLVIRNMSGNGITLTTGTGGNAIQGCYIGTNPAGSAAAANGGDGISISSPSGPLPPAGLTLVDDNVISGNEGDGIDIFGPNTTLVTVIRNFIGTDRNGLLAVPNGSGSGDNHGVRISADAYGNIIGGAPPTQSNVIAGNDATIFSNGISVQGDALLPNVILGNFIGLTPALVLDLGNGNAGIDAFDVQPHDDSPTEVALIIGPTNVIGYNGSTDDPAPGIRITGTSRGVYVFLNAIGVAEDPSGFVDLGNSGDGVEVTSGPSFIGVDDLDNLGGNFIGNNGESGIDLSGNDVVVQGNLIGDPDPDDAFAMGNDGDGIKISFGGHNTIGGAAGERANTIRGNGLNGIRVQSGSAWANLITRNKIDSNGQLAIDLDYFLASGVVDPRDNATSPDPTPGVANNGQNAPTLLGATYSGGSGQTTITWQLESVPNTAGFVLEFFSSPAGDASGSGEAATFLGEVTGVTTDAAGFASGVAPVSPGSPTNTSGMAISATARATYIVPDLPGPTLAGPANDTSELSNFAIVKTFSIADASVVEGNAGATSLLVTLTRTDSVGAASVQVSTANGTATAGSDYVALAGQPVVFADGQATQTAIVTVNGDLTFEPNETLLLTLSSPSSGWGIDEGQGTGSIQNDDTVPNASISDVAQLEGNSGTTAFVFTVSLSNPTYLAAPIFFSTANGSATAPGDFAPLASSFLIPPEATSQTITIEVVGDTTPEVDETFFVNISSPAPGGGTVIVIDPQGQGTIQNDDAVTEFSIGDAAQAEGNAGTTALVFTVSRTDAAAAASVDWSTAPGTASTPADFTTVAATTLAFAAGEATRQVTVDVVGETLFEPNEAFTVNLSNPSSGWSIGDGQSQGIIQNDDAQPSISIGDLAAFEGNAGNTPFTFTVALSNPSSQPVSVVAQTTDDTAVAPGDYAANGPQTLTFAPGVTVQAFTVQVAGDTAVEANEVFRVNLSAETGATLADAQALGTISNDDGVLQFSVGDVSAVEGNAGSTAVVFTVSRTETTAAASIDWSTAAGTATSPADFTAVAPTPLAFAPGQGTRQVTVDVIGETIFEGNETFFLNLSNPSSGWSIGDGQGVGTIQNDDALPAIAIADRSALEGDAGSTAFLFTLSLSNPSSQTVTVLAQTADGTAAAPGDYTAVAPLTVTFDPGATSQPFTVQVAGDTAVESDEAFVVNLSGASGATLPDGQAVGTIQNDDGVFAFSLDDVSALEGDAGATAFVFTVSRTDTTEAAAVDWSTAAGSATAPADFTAIAATPLAFAAGQATRQVTVDVSGELVFEGNETFTVNLSNPSAGWTIGDGQGTGTIQNDDVQPALTIADLAQFEGTGGTTAFTFQLTLTAPSGFPVTGSFSTTDGTAGSPGDFAALALEPFTLPAGTTSAGVTVQVVADATVEPAELFTASLSLVTGAAVGDGTAQAEILDDDGAPQFAIGDVAGPEGTGSSTALLFTVSRTTATGSATVQLTTADGSATSPDDFGAVSGVTVSFAAGELTRQVAVDVVGDSAFEGNETFTAVLSDPSPGYGLADPQGIGTILDDDAQPTIAIGDFTAFEGTSGSTDFELIVWLSNPSASPVAVDFATSDGSATAPDDYLADAGTIEFAPGETSRVVIVTVFGDTATEGDETFFVSLGNPAGAAIADAQGVATILDGGGASVVEIPVLDPRGLALFMAALAVAALARLAAQRRARGR